MSVATVEALAVVGPVKRWEGIVVMLEETGRSLQVVS
jgi:hypothetical protein